MVFVNWLAQVIILPLLKSFGEWVVKVFKRKKKVEEIGRENQSKVEAYEQAQTNDDARDAFDKLP